VFCGLDRDGWLFIERRFSQKRFRDSLPAALHSPTTTEVFMRLIRSLTLAIAAAALLPAAAQAQTFASSVSSLLRGSFPGDFPGQFYGGNFPGVFPVVLTPAQAQASVLGAPDGAFLSLPGGPQIPGTAFTGAYVEVNFGRDYSSADKLMIWELGDNQEKADLWLWQTGGGFLQLNVDRTGLGAFDPVVVDLAPYAAFGTFTKLGIGGLDENGASKGFDLDAVALAPVPEPETYALMLAGLAAVVWMSRRRRA
jgi:hypothetical protein